MSPPDTRLGVAPKVNEKTLERWGAPSFHLLAHKIVVTETPPYIRWVNRHLSPPMSNISSRSCRLKILTGTILKLLPAYPAGTAFWTQHRCAKWARGVPRAPRRRRARYARKGDNHLLLTGQQTGPFEVRLNGAPKESAVLLACAAWKCARRATSPDPSSRRGTTTNSRINV